VTVPIKYREIRIDAGYRLDLLIDRLVIVENKAAERLLSIHAAQLLTYLRLTNLKLGFLINWNVPLLRDGLHRYVNEL
jgi:GxxExxY protein